jgi:tetratricopeptide (TPR) repeat protein
LWSDTAEPVAQPVETTLSKSPEQTPVTTSHLDALSSLVASRAEAQSNPAASVPSNTQPAAAAPAAPTDQSNTSLDFELETTMKRPVVRLQPMQQRPSVQQQQQQIPSRSRSGELPPPHQAEGSALSNKQRLIKGYQYQLGGLYDEAMQEYRFIIGKAPELLGEVVSNMRALLKIAPRYSAGYRVLGDAYMRQGEYLQAMEAYNKALAMAKKTKS